MQGLTEKKVFVDLRMNSRIKFGWILKDGGGVENIYSV